MTPQMPLMLQENFTVKLLEMLRTGEIDCAILAEPFPGCRPGDCAAVRRALRRCGAAQPCAGQGQVGQRRTAQVRNHAAAGHRPLLPRPCAGGLPRVRALFRHGRRHTAQLRGLVAGNHQAHGGGRHGRDAGAAPGRAGAGLGAGARPGARTKTRSSSTCRSSTEPRAHAPTRRVVLAWRRSFTRYEAIAALRNAVYACELPGVKRLS